MKDYLIPTDAREEEAVNRFTKHMFGVEQQLVGVNFDGDAVPRVSNAIHIHALIIGLIVTADNNGLSRAAILEEAITAIRAEHDHLDKKSSALAAGATKQ